MSQSVIENEFAPLSLSVGEIDQAGLSPIEGGGVSSALSGSGNVHH